MKMSPLHMTLGTSEAPRFRPPIRPLFLAPRRLVGRTSHPTSYSQTQTQTSTHVVHPHLHLQSPSKEFQPWISPVLRLAASQQPCERYSVLHCLTPSIPPLSSSSSFARVSPSAQTANSARSADPLRGLRLRLPPFILSLASPVSTPRFRSFDAAAAMTEISTMG